MDIPGKALAQVAKEFEIDGKLVRAYELITELEPILDELKEYGFVSPILYIAPFGYGTSERGKAYVTRAYNLMLELDAKETEETA